MTKIDEQWLKNADLPELHEKHQEYRILLAEISNEYERLALTINERAAEHDDLRLDVLALADVGGHESARRDYNTRLRTMSLKELRETHAALKSK